MQKIKNIFSFVLICILLSSCSSGPLASTTETIHLVSAEQLTAMTPDPFYSEAEESVQPSQENTELSSVDRAHSANNEPRSVQGPGDFSITMLDVGQGLCLVIQADGETMVYDGGGRKNSSYVVSYMQKHGITHLDYMIASHYDEDHIAGLVGLLNTQQVDCVLCGDYSADTKIYQSFLSALKAESAEVVHPTKGYEFQLGRANVKVLSPCHYQVEKTNENDLSIVILIRYGDFGVLITGDAQEAAEKQMLESGENLSAVLYVVGHHGSSSSSSAEFVQAVRPQYAFISCGVGNDYGHPTEKTLQTLRDVGAELFRTDFQGEVTFYTDGTILGSDQKPTENWSHG